jgi:hypothetical protein
MYVKNEPPICEYSPQSTSKVVKRTRSQNNKELFETLEISTDDIVEPVQEPAIEEYTPFYYI